MFIEMCFESKNAKVMLFFNRYEDVSVELISHLRQLTMVQSILLDIFGLRFDEQPWIVNLHVSLGLAHLMLKIKNPGNMVREPSSFCTEAFTKW